jgi:hypothetical protein
MQIHIRGDTFDFSGPLSLTEGGSPVVDFSGWGARSMVRNANGTLIEELAVTWVDAVQGIIRLRSQNTSSWPVGRARFDIELTSPTGDTVSTRAANLEIVADVTFNG